MNEVEVIEKIQDYNNNLLEEVNNLEITDDETLKKGADYLKKLKDTAKLIDKREKEFTKPLNDTLKRIRDVFRPQKELINKITAILSNDKILPYHKEVEKQKRIEAEEERKIEVEKLKVEQAEKLKKAEDEKSKIDSEKALDEAVVIEQKTEIIEKKEIKVDTKVKTETGSMNVRKTWKYEITDPKLVPHEFCEPSKSLIDHAVKSGKREIAGIRIYEKETIVSR